MNGTNRNEWMGRERIVVTITRDEKTTTRENGKSASKQASRIGKGHEKVVRDEMNGLGDWPSVPVACA